MKNDIKAALSEALADAKRVAVLGCGSVLAGDDAAGMRVAERLTELGAAAPRGDVRVYCGSTAPENFSGEIKRFGPDVLLVIDAADMGLRPGGTALIPVEEITGASFSTHMLPLRILLDYLRGECGCRACLLGIQGGCMEFGNGMTPPVSAAVDTVADMLRELLTNAG
ncbi:MAG: hydrogenase 3 maturation endopeptidase HyCI [Firmicutes bacterium]|nr:hydrogenase 3 maturation endopeptidase HyCI [Bacillota bacterium]